jgi:solute carrier family 35, member F5
MAPSEPLLPAELQPEHARQSLSLSDSGGDIDLSASIASVARSNRSNRSTHSKSGRGWRTKMGLGGVARRTLGIMLLLVTVFLWTASNFLASVSAPSRPQTEPDAFGD